MGFTNSAVAEMLEDIIGGGITIELFTDAPSDDGTLGTKPSGASYKPVTLVSTGSNNTYLEATIGADKQYQNHTIIQFPIARGDNGWGTITHVGILKNNKLVFWDELLSPVAVSKDSIAVFDIGELMIGIDRDGGELAAANPVPPTD